MNSEILNRIRGQKISRFLVVHYPPIGIDRVILHLESGLVVEFKPREIKFGPYEADVLDVRERNEGTHDIASFWTVDSIDAGWTVGNIEVYARQDWLEPAGPPVKTIGNNPITHAWGSIGAASKEATHAVTVIAFVILVSDRRDREAMISLAVYPGTVSFTTDVREIASVREEYGSAKGANSR